MDVKTLSAILGHVSAATTLDIYAHVTNTMQAEQELLLDQARGIVLPKKLTQKQRQIWEYMKIHPRETNLSAIARGAGVNRHTAAKHCEMIRGMVGSG